MNRENNTQEELLREVKRLLVQSQPGGDLAPATTREQWEEVIESTPASSRELLRELARFADLWRYLSEREQQLGEAVTSRLRQVHCLAVGERVVLLKQINGLLMRRVKRASIGPESRH